MTPPKKRPAHRPSRRGEVVQAAMRLFAGPGADAVTVAEIAETAGMTSAAVYYHFASKDDILLEGLRGFGEALVAESRRLQQSLAAEGGQVGDLPVRLLAWCDTWRDAALAWFVTSSGASLAVEQLRRELRNDLVAVLTKAARSARGKLPAAEAAVVATGLLALIDTAAVSWLTRDESVTGLGEDGFLAETRALGNRLAGV